MKIPFLSFEHMHLPLKAEMLAAFEQFYDKGWYIMGDELSRFEQQYAAFNQTSYAVGVSNGLDALHIALKVLGIKEGDEVIVPSNTYIATLLAVSYTGATPVLAEPDPATYNIDPDNIRKAISSKTKAILPVHLYGQACNMTAICALAEEYGLFVVEDNAQAHAASWNQQLTGSWGHINATSFYPGKNLGALGDAGALTTNDAALAQQAKSLRNYGSQKKYYNEVIGFNNRLDECQAAFLNVKLKHIHTWSQQRQQIAGLYDEQLRGIGDLVLPVTATGATHVYHLYVIRSKQRDALQQYLSTQGIGTLIHYPVPPHLQEAYQSLGFTKDSFPIAEEIANTCLSIPLWPGMEAADVQTVCATIGSFFK